MAVVHCMSRVPHPPSVGPQWPAVDHSFRPPAVGRTLCGADGDYIFLSSALNNPDRVSCAACRAELARRALEASEH